MDKSTDENFGGKMHRGGDRKLFFFDIDDTLTSELDGHVPFSAKEAIRQAQEKGHLAYINTGRCLQTVAPEILAFPFDGFVCGCGTSIYDKELKLVRGFDSVHGGEEAEALQKLAEACHADMILEGREAMALIAGGHPLTGHGAYHFTQYRQKKLKIMETSDPDFSFDKFTAWFRQEEDIPRFLEKTGGIYEFINRGKNGDSVLTEFIPKGYSKAEGIRTVCRITGIPLENVWVFGDSNNDMPMFEAVSHSVAMGNSNSDQLRSRAEFITGKASEGGLAEAIRRILGEEKPTG